MRGALLRRSPPPTPTPAAPCERNLRSAYVCPVPRALGEYLPTSFQICFASPPNVMCRLSAASIGNSFCRNCMETSSNRAHVPPEMRRPSLPRPAGWPLPSICPPCPPSTAGIHDKGAAGLVVSPSSDMLQHRAGGGEVKTSRASSGGPTQLSQETHLPPRIPSFDT